MLDGEAPSCCLLLLLWCFDEAPSVWEAGAGLAVDGDD